MTITITQVTGVAGSPDSLRYHMSGEFHYGEKTIPFTVQAIKGQLDITEIRLLITCHEGDLKVITDKVNEDIWSIWSCIRTPESPEMVWIVMISLFLNYTLRGCMRKVEDRLAETDKLLKSVFRASLPADITD